MVGILNLYSHNWKVLFPIILNVIEFNTQFRCDQHNLPTNLPHIPRNIYGANKKKKTNFYVYLQQWTSRRDDLAWSFQCLEPYGCDALSFAENPTDAEEVIAGRRCWFVTNDVTPKHGDSERYRNAPDSSPGRSGRPRPYGTQNWISTKDSQWQGRVGTHSLRLLRLFIDRAARCRRVVGTHTRTSSLHHHRTTWLM